ncbi:nitrite/sulfite reductase [Mucisphaera calidilacus]|uniref:Sulfite reductase [ferredoxin] n=1 Tax=Mucisphaera calidilacus TaxID=2527982 RepID=A0A518BV53_9BACT|nr:nitrite/sulfite reductase [Mucisphaera calidilacus]QDU70873.1 Sulfite reductase [ferredoxin] [Mucisphaera calidilacus]
MATKVNKVEELKKAKDGFDVLQDLLNYSDAGDYDAIPEDDVAQRFKWFGIYRQKPNTGHFMIRLRIPAGQLVPSQLKVIAQLCDQYARGFGDITTRQTLQFHWLTISDLRGILQALWDIGLSSQFACGDAPRNVVGCPLAGVLKDEIIDSSEHARQISDMFVEAGREFSNLPRKFKPSIGGCKLHCHQPQINCFGFYGATHDGEPGYGLLVGGGLSSTPHFGQPMRAFIKPDQVLDVARAIAIVFRDHGYRDKRTRARLKFLVADKGWQWTRDAIEHVLDKKLIHDDSLVSPPATHHDHMGIGEQKDGSRFVGIPIERGRLTAKNMADAAELAEKYGTGEKRIRLTGKQNMILLDIPAQNVEPLTRELDAAGLTPHAHRLRDMLISCTGSEFCNLAVVETKHRAGRVLRYLEEHTDLDQDIAINFTGCPNACSQYQVADIGLTGIPVVLKDKKGPDGKPLKVDGYKVLLGARLGTDPRFGEVIAKKVEGDKIHLALKNLIDHYLDERADDDESFGMWVDRSQPEYLQSLITTPVEAEDAQPLTA